MKIKLNQDLPIDAKHECFKGCVFEVIDTSLGRDEIYFFYSKATGAKCGAFEREFDFLVDL